MYLYLQVKDRCMEVGWSRLILCVNIHISMMKNVDLGRCLSKPHAPLPDVLTAVEVSQFVHLQKKSDKDILAVLICIYLYMYSTSSLLLLFPPDTVNSVRLGIVDFLEYTDC